MFTLEELENAFAPQISNGHNTLIYVLVDFEYNANTLDSPNIKKTIKYINITEKPIQELYNELVAESKWLAVEPWQPEINTVVAISNKITY